jgi:hypothetical protein
VFKKLHKKGRAVARSVQDFVPTKPEILSAEIVADNLDAQHSPSLSQFAAERAEMRSQGLDRAELGGGTILLAGLYVAEVEVGWHKADALLPDDAWNQIPTDFQVMYRPHRPILPLNLPTRQYTTFTNYFNDFDES